jgi:hypothetical protein
MPQLQTKKVTFKVAQAVELRAGLVLPPGFYAGTETRTRLEPVGSGQNWTDPRYTIKFTAGHLASIGAMNFDVTKFVRSGQLIVV